MKGAMRHDRVELRFRRSQRVPARQQREIMSTHATPPAGRPSLIEKLSAASAFVGGAILTGITLMAVTSIVMRSLGFEPIQGDFELVQVALAGCIALMLPWCQLQGGNLTVDFFTVRLRKSRRTCAGAIAVKASHESTMILGFPLWIGYVAMIPGLLLTVFAALQSARTAWKESRH